MATYPATPADQNVVGSDERDVMNGGRGDDTLAGGLGDDILNGGVGEDSLVGGAGNDKLHAGAGDDTLVGGLGDDSMSGGGGADLFQFAFTAGGSSTVTQEFHFTPDPGADGKLQQGELSSQFSNFLAASVPDVDGDGLVEWAWSPNGPNGQLSVTITEGADADPSDGVTSVATEDPVTALIYKANGTPANDPSDNYDATVVVTTVVSGPPASPDGHDVIDGFQWGLDDLDFGPVTQQQFLDYFQVDESDVDGDGVLDTVITITGDATWSLTLLGVSGHSLADWAGLFA